MSGEGLKCLAGTATGPYLRNRLMLAYLAGWEAAQEECERRLLNAAGRTIAEILHAT